MVKKREIGLLCHKVGDNFVFFIETNLGPFIYVVHSGTKINAFFSRFHDLQQDRFMILEPELAHECQLELKVLSETSRFTD